MVIEQIPSPLGSQPTKISTLAQDFKLDTPIYRKTREAIVRCETKDPLVIFVAKMQPFPSRLYDATTKSNE